MLVAEQSIFEVSTYAFDKFDVVSSIDMKSAHDETPYGDATAPVPPEKAKVSVLAFVTTNKERTKSARTIKDLGRGPTIEQL